MNTLQIYKNKIINIFFLSVDKDLNLWTQSGSNFFSPDYKGSILNIDLIHNSLYLYKDSNYIKIIKYKSFLYMDFKICRYIRKLKKYLKNSEINKKNSEDIKFFKTEISKMEEHFVAETRKEKLDYISKKIKS